jgi:monoamine oxidase
LIHGDCTSLAALVREHKLETEHVFTWAHGDSGPEPEHTVNGCGGYYYVGRDRSLLRFDAQDEDFVALNEALWEIPEMDPDKVDRNATLGDYLKQKGISPRMIAMAEAGYANTVCTSMRNLGLRNIVRLEHAWELDGDNEYRLPGSMQQVIGLLLGDTQVWTNWPVARVNWDVLLPASADNKQPPCCARVWSDNGDSVLARKVIVTASLAVLQNELIDFTPPLPASKRDAISKLVMEPTIKVLLRFRKPFWPADMHGMICSDSIVPEFWVAQHHRSPDDPEEQEHIIVAFATSDYARRLTCMKRSAMQSAILSQLNFMFACHEKPNPSDPADMKDEKRFPAFALFKGLVIEDWGNNKYVGGGYTSPTTNATPDDQTLREEWGQPVADRLYFAGEGPQAASGTLNAAMDSGTACGTAVAKQLFAEKCSVRSKL